MDDLFLSLHQTARRADGGISGLARRLGKREKTLLSKLDPADDTHQPTLGEFVAILGDTGDLAPLEVLCAMFGCRLLTRTRERAESVMHAVLAAAGEQGDVIKAVQEALSDGRLTARERDQILREIADARRALTVLENTLLAREGT